MPNIFKIHPSIGISRLGDSTSDFCLAPETPMGQPIQCDHQGRALLDAQGNEQTIDLFKDAQGRIKRQGARFRVYVYRDANDKVGRELKTGDLVEVRKPQTDKVYRTILLGIEWTVYLANKKASWYQSTALQGNSPNHLLRNPTIKDATARQRLIIDPGPQTVSYSTSVPTHAKFAKGKNPAFPQSFPSTLSPKNIDTLGEVIANQQDNYNRLIVLGGHGHSGAFQQGAGELHIENGSNDGWFDDVSDGPVTATLWLQHLMDDCALEEDLSPFTIPVDDPAWVLVTYPGYVPAIENMTALDDVVYDVSVRKMDYNPEIYAHRGGWNKQYHPDFSRDIWPILCRPNIYQRLVEFDLDAISVPDNAGQDPVRRQANAAQRQSVLDILRKPGQSSSVLHLTETQLFFLQQWVNGKFVNDKCEADKPQSISGTDIDRGVLWNALGGAFSPSGEIYPVVSNPIIYASPYRIKHAPYVPGWLSQPAVAAGMGAVSDLRFGLEPGDLTKYSSLPWQADFNECANQDVDVTYESWLRAYSSSVEDSASMDAEKGVFWWAARRPLQVFLPMRDPANSRNISGRNHVPWMRTSSKTRARDLQRANAWVAFGFIHNIDLEDIQLVETENSDTVDNLHWLLDA